jgi:hypothetical protein
MYDLGIEVFTQYLKFIILNLWIGDLKLISSAASTHTFKHNSTSVFRSSHALSQPVNWNWPRKWEGRGARASSLGLRLVKLPSNSNLMENEPDLSPSLYQSIHLSFTEINCLVFKESISYKLYNNKLELALNFSKFDRNSLRWATVRSRTWHHFTSKPPDEQQNQSN